MTEQSVFVSVIILNWNGGDYLLRCVKSVLESDYPKNLLEVVVVDNGSTDGSAEAVKKVYPQIKLIKNKKNLGYCLGNNIGIKNAKGELIILLNNDTIVDKHWIKEILKKVKDPEVGIVGCKLYFPGTKIIQSIGFREKFLGYWESIGAGQIDVGQFDNIEEVDYVSGAALAVKREVLERIGLLDPNFYAYSEDIDLCYRARRSGYKVVTSNAIVYHYGSLSWSRFPLKKMYLIMRNRIYFIRKHYSPKALIKFIFIYPIKSTWFDLYRSIKGETILQKIINQDKRARQQKLFVEMLNIVTTRCVILFIAILLE
ncbi:MAG: glycosyltransferase family 2 protein, partial [Thermofilaceae archaeon]